MAYRLILQGVEAGYGDLRVLRGIDLAVAEGEIVAILGPNGAGKSTLLGAISGLVRATAGRILLDGRDITGTAPQRLVRSGLAHVPERRHVFASMTVRENLLLGANPRIGRDPMRAIEADVATMEGLFPVLGERRGQDAGTLSGGEQQMLAIARGLMSRPSVLLLDEPSLGLAPLVVRDIFRVVSELPSGGCAVLLVEQNARAALGVASRGYVLELGRIVAAASAGELAADATVSAGYLRARAAPAPAD